MSLNTLAFRRLHFYRYIAQFYALLPRFYLIEVILLGVLNCLSNLFPCAMWKFYLIYDYSIFFVTSKVQIVIITTDFGKSSKILLVIITFLQHVTQAYDV